MIASGSAQLPPPPRLVRRRKGEFPKNGCVTIPFILVGIGFLLTIPVRFAVLHFGTPVTVVVDGKTESISSKHNSTTYHVQFHYLFEGQMRNDRQQVSADEYGLVHVGQEASGRAMRFMNWTVCISNVGDPTTSTILFVFFAVVWNGFILLMLFFLVGPSIQAKHLVRDGTAVAGVVTGRQIIRNRSRNYYVVYDFKTADGTAMTQKMRINSAKLYDASAEGMVITVLYDGQKPKRNVAYEFCGYEVVPLMG